MREIHVNAQRSYLTGCVNRHLANVEVLISNPVGIGEHQDLQKSIETELGSVSEYLGKLEVLNKFLTPIPQQQEESEKTDDSKKKA